MKYRLFRSSIGRENKLKLKYTMGPPVINSIIYAIEGLAEDVWGKLEKIMIFLFRDNSSLF